MFSLARATHSTLPAIFLYSPSKFIAAIGVHDSCRRRNPRRASHCPRGHAQDVAKLVKELESKKMKSLL